MFRASCPSCKGAWSPIVGRALVVGDLSVISLVVSRRLMCVASVIIAVTVVVILWGGIPTTVRVASDAVGAHTLLPTAVGVTVVAELTDMEQPLR